MNSMKNDFNVIFSSGVRVMQVENAYKVARMGSTVVGVVGRNCVVLGVERSETNELQMVDTTQRIHKISDTIAVGCAGLLPDAGVILDRSMAECARYSLATEQPVTVNYITDYIARLKQENTQTGLRPYGVMCLIGGFENDGSPHLYDILPNGVYQEWKAMAIGRHQATVVKYFRENYNENHVQSVEGTIKLAFKGLLLLAQFALNKLEICIVEKNKPLTILNGVEIMDYICSYQDAEI